MLSLYLFFVFSPFGSADAVIDKFLEKENTIGIVEVVAFRKDDVNREIFFRTNKFESVSILGVNRIVDLWKTRPPESLQFELTLVADEGNSSSVSRNLSRLGLTMINPKTDYDVYFRGLILNSENLNYENTKIAIEALVFRENIENRKSLEEYRSRSKSQLLKHLASNRK